MAAKEFMSLGFKDVLDYKGGIQEWSEKGYPVERS
jgi:rhodanese-related sulfurtransferase